MDRKTAANRANALKSTGPTSPEGRRNAARNATRHGLLRAGAASAILAKAQARADLYCAEDPSLDPLEALVIASTLVKAADVARAQAQELDRALANVDPDLPWALREDLARLAVLRRLVALNNYERRSGGALRRHLRKLAKAA